VAITTTTALQAELNVATAAFTVLQAERSVDLDTISYLRAKAVHRPKVTLMPLPPMPLVKVKDEKNV
jgi:hypothetical protein